jgi:hypothetical protein
MRLLASPGVLICAHYPAQVRPKARIIQLECAQMRPLSSPRVPSCAHYPARVPSPAHDPA